MYQVDLCYTENVREYFLFASLHTNFHRKQWIMRSVVSPFVWKWKCAIVDQSTDGGVIFHVPRVLR